MKKLILCLTLIFVITHICLVYTGQETAEFVLLNGKVFTVSEKNPQEAIKYYTYGPAYASFEEDIKGSLETGKLADMVVLSGDLFSIRRLHILKTEVLYTILGGKIVYRKSFNGEIVVSKVL